MPKVVPIRPKNKAKNKVKIDGKNIEVQRFHKKKWYEKADKYNEEAEKCYGGCMDSPLENVVNCQCPICHGRLHGVGTLRKLSEPAQRRELALVKDHFMHLAGELTTKQIVANTTARVDRSFKRIAAKRMPKRRA